MKTAKQRVGMWGEKLAANYLTARGYTILGQNIRTPFGEIDLLARDANTTVFIEVKTRTSDAFGMPEVAITHDKQMHMVEAAEAYLQDHPELSCDWRVDVVAIRGIPGRSEPEIILFENALY